VLFCTNKPPPHFPNELIIRRYTKVEIDGKGPGKNRETTSKINLVDLAGICYFNGGNRGFEAILHRKMGVLRP
jgi:hypothetical protein